ncbi:glycosyltransferase [Cellulosimicrobium cellulans]|uniref:glycosyltransferase n=1 Tax=Cellulosimicrobium cellulans TaxID=1710 RepID=UPI0021CAE470|nr:glycosyltransferase family 2 protein [Cellulosimicrobium cellulans]
MTPGDPALPDAEYVLPLRWAEDHDLPDLAGYLGRLVAWLPVTVVDGSGDARFAAHARAFPAAVRHVRPDPHPGRNGKVAGVVTGLRLARTDRVVLADDDVRYDEPALRAVLDRLAEADVVRPQNVFVPMPWHARWDTARSLVNRATGGDYPGTLAVRRTALGPEGYDDDVLFENLELLRTVRARGGRVLRADDVYVPRRPPTTRHFLAQRPRQAYDSLAQPGRFAAELAVLPAVVLAARRAPRLLLLLAAAACALAESGRRRAGGADRFPVTASLLAPAWLLERAVCAWLALALRATGGARYGGARLPRAATSPRELRARTTASPATRGGHPDHAAHVDDAARPDPADGPPPGRPSPAPRHLETA